VVVGGSSGMGLATAHQVVAGGGTAVITGREQDWVWAAVEALSQNGKAWGITPRGPSAAGGRRARRGRSRGRIRTAGRVVRYGRGGRRGTARRARVIDPPRVPRPGT
jgi:NAD(P)-dependent dehydrogenase (short-subunit alcohol dehydrogenase family)